MNTHDWPTGISRYQRRTNRTQEKHTPQSMHKERTRRWWLDKVDPQQDVITISHGLFLELDRAEWKGRIQACDLDPGVRAAIAYLRVPSYNSGSGDYPSLNILPPGEGICSTIHHYNQQYGMSQLGAVDVDLAKGVESVWVHVMQHVLNLLLMYGYHGKVLLTFKNGRDRKFGDTQDRINWLCEQLPRGAEYITHRTYNSAWISEYGQRHKGASMCCAELAT